MYSFQIDADNTKPSPEDYKKTSPSSKQEIRVSSELMQRICLRFNLMIVKNHKNPSLFPEEDIFAEESLNTPLESMETTLQSIIRFLQESFPNNEELAEEINATLIYLKRNIDTFVKKGHLLTRNNISNITKAAFMLSHKTYIEDHLILSSYAKILYTWPAIEKNPQLNAEDATKENKKKLKTLVLNFLKAINYEVYVPIKKLTSIYKIPISTLFRTTDNKLNKNSSQTDTVPRRTSCLPPK